MKINKTIPVLLLSMISALSTNAMAEGLVRSTTMKTTAQVDKNCSITAENMNFGELQVATQINGGKSKVFVLCNKGTSYSLLLDYGTPQESGYVVNGRYNSALLTGKTHGDTIAYGIQLGTVFNMSVLSWMNAATFVASGNLDTIDLVGNASFGYMGTKQYPAQDTYTDTNTLTLTF